MTHSDDKPDIQAALDKLTQEFSKKIPDKVTEIEHAWEALKSSPDDNGKYQMLHRLVHTLVGSTATYGFEEVSDCAKHIELTLQSLPEQRSQCLPLDVIDSLLKKLWQVSELEVTRKKSEQAIIKGFSTAMPAQVDRGNLVYLVDDDIDVLGSMKLQIEAFGYEVQTFSDLIRFEQAVQRREPNAVIMDVMFDSGATAGIDNIARINSLRVSPLECIFITSSNDISTRLSAVRANGRAYFIKPVLIEQLVEALNTLTHKTVEAPFNIVIVEDSKAQSQYIALTLQEVGMKTKEVNGPLELLNVLAEYPADLILMDLYMPDCTGLELSQVVRQIEAYVGIPIVYLSAESNLAKKLSAISLGGDDFLSKPIEPWHLISAVTSRVLRGRKLRKLTETDGLTGLLNHNKCKERLDAELSRAKRENTPLSFAMLDIDHFKQVNDTYGHPVGDRVLKSLASMLKQRLRQYDIVCRYGGEEFAVILPNTDAETAKMVMDSVRVSFGEVSHSSDSDDLNCHFSCGISSFPDISNSTKLINEADKMLYEAKHNGRNRVIMQSVNSPQT